MRLKYLALSSVLFSNMLFAATVTIPMYLTNTQKHQKDFVGHIVATDTQYGLMLTPHLSHLVPTLNPGPHGFHVHLKPTCANHGLAAEGHFDPSKTHHHLGPYGAGHQGDLPALAIAENGTATIPLVAPRLSVKAILGHSLMIHAGGDTYSDHPTLGGGGARMICGVVPTQSQS